MCDHCGCATPKHTHAHDHDHHHDHAHDAGDTSRQIDIHTAVMAHNNRFAEQNRGYFRAKGLFAVNLLSAPGAGKTALIESTLTVWREAQRIAVVVGDLQTENDANRVRARGAEAVQITTGEVCHLDAHMVQHAVEDLALTNTGILLIENVGNLVCPASFDLGEHARVVLMSVTEGEDKPLKYPVIFHHADLIVLSKIDLAAAVAFDRAKALANIRKVAPRAAILEVSARSGEGMVAWCAWLQAGMRGAVGPAKAGTTNGRS